MGIKPFWDTHHIVLQCIITIVKTTIIAAWDRQAAPRLRTCFSHAWAGKFNRLPILQMELLAAPGFRPLHFAIWTFLNHMTTISQGNQPPLHPKPQRDWGFSAARTWHPQSFASLVVFWVGNPKKHQIAWAFMIFQTNDQANYKIWHDMTIYDLIMADMAWYGPYMTYVQDTLLTQSWLSPSCHPSIYVIGRTSRTILSKPSDVHPRASCSPTASSFV